jgi:hypothetical protein
MKHNEIRKRELKTLAKSMAKQFGLTNVLDIQALEEELLARYADGTELTSKYSTSEAASSAKFRQDVRNALIDIIATLGHLKAIDKEYSTLEQSMRNKIDMYAKQIEEIRKQLINSDTDNARTIEADDLMKFSESTTGLEYVQGILRPGTQRVPVGELTTASIDYTLYPVVDTDNNVLVTTLGDMKNLVRTGLNSRSWTADVYTSIEPKFSLNISGLEDLNDTSIDCSSLSGIVCRIELDLSDNPITTSELEIDFQQPVRIIGLIGDGQVLKDNDTSLPIITIASRREHILPLPENTYSNLVVYVNVPRFVDRTPYTEILADQYDSDQVYVGATLNPDGFMSDINRPDYYHYELGIYNLKFRLPSTVTSGTLVTTEFKSQGALRSAELVHRGKGSPIVNTIYHQDDLVSDTLPDAFLPRTETYDATTFPDPITAITLLETPYIGSYRKGLKQGAAGGPISSDIMISLKKAEEADVEVTLITAPGNMLPQFSNNTDPECFLLRRTLVFKTPIDLTEYDSIEINYNVLLTGVHFEIVHATSDWTHSYTVLLHDNLQ